MLPLIWIASIVGAFGAWSSGNVLAGLVVMAVGYAIGKAVQTREGENRLAKKIRSD